MKTSEAVKLMEEGKKVRRKDWGKETYIYMNEEGWLMTDWEGEFEIVELSDDWEEYIESKTKKIEELDDGLHIENPTKNEEKILIAIIEHRDAINELIERVNELCGEK